MAIMSWSAVQIAILRGWIQYSVELNQKTAAGRLLCFLLLGDVLLFPPPAVFDQFVALLCECVVVRALILAAFLDERVFDQSIKVRIQPPVIDVINVFLHFAADRLPRWFVRACNHVQEVALEAGQFEYLSHTGDIVCLPVLLVGRKNE